MKKLIIYLCFAYAVSVPIPAFAASIEDQVVNIIVTSQKNDYSSPWRKGEITRNNITGCVIEGNRILTTSYAIADSVLIEVMKKGEPRKYTARPIIRDYHCGLAVLEVEDRGFFNGLRPVEFSEEGGLIGETARVYKWDSMTNLKEFTAELNKSSIRFYEPSCGVLMHQLSTVMNEGGNGEPVFIHGKLVGITTGLNTGTKTLYALASDVVRTMLKDLAGGAYKGIPFFWISSVDIQSDENLHEYFGMAGGESGVIITEVPSISSGSDVLKKNDIILAINGTPLDDNGMYNSGRYGKLYYYGLIQMNKFVGDEIMMKILRDRKRIDVRFRLRAVPDQCCVIPLITNDRRPGYYIFGGLVMQELTIGYLESFGSEWKKRGDKRMLYFYDNVKSMADEGIADRIVILNRVLPDPVNKGYQSYGNLILTGVNGVKVKNIAQLKKIIESSRSRFVVLDFAGDTTVVLDKKSALAGEKELLYKYDITSSYSDSND
jgi:hypothetical protein